MKRANVNVRDDQHEKLKRLSEKTGATMSALVRKALDAYLKRSRRK
jgi:predicted DNA-binding protein